MSWAYVGKKEAHKTEEEMDDPFIGDQYTFVALEAKSKLAVCFALGRRDTDTAIEFMGELLATTIGRFQLSTDGFGSHITAVKKVFGDNIDYAQLVKSFSSNGEDEQTAERRYSPGEFVRSTKSLS